MPFHVEISGSLNHARAFNLSADQLHEAIVRPWLAEQAIKLGEREWQPRKSSLRILEGPELETPELSFSQGWANAERSAVDVTRRVLAHTAPPAMPDAFVVETELPEGTVAEMLNGQVAQPLAWNEAQAKVDGRDPRVAAVIIVTRPNR